MIRHIGNARHIEILRDWKLLGPWVWLLLIPHTFPSDWTRRVENSRVHVLYHCPSSGVMVTKKPFSRNLNPKNSKKKHDGPTPWLGFSETHFDTPDCKIICGDNWNSKSRYHSLHNPPPSYNAHYSVFWRPWGAIYGYIPCPPFCTSPFDHQNRGGVQ